MSKEYLQLFSNCIIVDGASRSIICDLQRNVFKLIPKSLSLLFGSGNVLDVELLKLGIEPAELMVFDKYLEMLVTMEYVFKTVSDEGSNFPPLSLEWDYPGVVSNLIIELDSESNFDFNCLMNQSLSEINCRFVEFRSYGFLALEAWSRIISIVNSSEISAIDIITSYSEEIEIEAWVEWVSNNRKIRSLIFHSCAETKVIRKREHGCGVVLLMEERIDSSMHCGNIHPSYFSVNIETFTESFTYNTCLNRKISIDARGEIKNCPSMKKSFGNISSTRLLDVATSMEFQRKWFINKDQIDKCKDCEFRRICTDCRGYLEDPRNEYSAPLKCGYNPFTCDWEDWSLNPLKNQIVDYYKEL